MDDFEKAQRLFKEYEKNGPAKSLEEALEILDGIVKSQGLDFQKAINLKNTIGKYLHSQLRNICVRGNLGDFSKYLHNSDEVLSFLNGSLSKEDATKFYELILIQTKYF